jgi:uncharacterized protein (DUF885 family)
MFAAGVALARAGAARAAPACPDIPAIDAGTAALLALLPEAAVSAGLAQASAGGAAARRCNDWSPEGNATLALAVAAARASLPADGCDPAAATVRAQLDMASNGGDAHYGRNGPLGGTHRPYLVTAFAGPHLSTPMAMRLLQDLSGPAAIDAWQARLESYAPALLGAAQSLRADAAAGCIPPAATSRAALPQMDAFVLVAPDRHPLVLALDSRLAAAGVDQPARALATTRAAATLARHVQPAMALLRDTAATLTRQGKADIALAAQPGGETLHAANVARAGDTAMNLAEAQALGRAEAARIAALLDARLAARGLRKGGLSERIAAAFAAHPEFVESDDDGGRAALLQLATVRTDAARAVAARLVPGGDVAALAIRPLPDAGQGTPGGSCYVPAAIDGSRDATLWLDTRSVHALPTPGVSPIACHLGIPGQHLQASRATAARPMLARIGAWPAFTEGWACYGERLAAEQGLFARDPWGDVARLSDELLRAARLVVDIGIHAQRWPREQAEAEMNDMTGNIQANAIDRIVALPGEAASATLGLHRLLALRTAAKARKRFDERAFHAAVLDPGPRPFALVEADLA